VATAALGRGHSIDRFQDLEPMIGRPNRVYEVLNRTRPLTLKMIWRLYHRLGIPAECLIKPPDASRAA
jgi:HTH-type transcriptional regulator/antitoxin HigA